MNQYEALGRAMHNYANTWRWFLKFQVGVDRERAAHQYLSDALANVFPCMEGPASDEGKTIENLAKRIEDTLRIGLRSKVNAHLYQN